MRRILAIAALSTIATVPTTAQEAWKGNLENLIQDRIERLDPWVEHAFLPKHRGGQGTLIHAHHGLPYRDLQTIQADYSMVYDGIGIFVRDTTKTRSLEKGADSIVHEMMHVLTDHIGHDTMLRNDRYDGPTVDEILAYARGEMQKPRYAAIVDSVMGEARTQLIDEIMNSASLEPGLSLFLESNALRDRYTESQNGLWNKISQNIGWGKHVTDAEISLLEQHIEQIENYIINSASRLTQANDNLRVSAEHMVDRAISRQVPPSIEEIDTLIGAYQEIHSRNELPVQTYISTLKRVIASSHRRAGLPDWRADLLLNNVLRDWQGDRLVKTQQENLLAAREGLKSVFYHEKPIEFIAYLYQSMVECVLDHELATEWVTNSDDDAPFFEATKVPRPSLRRIPLTEKDMDFFGSMWWDDAPMHESVIRRYRLAQRMQADGMDAESARRACMRPSVTYDGTTFVFRKPLVDVEVH